MGRKNKILKLGFAAEQAVLTMESKGKSRREIARQLSERFDEDVSHQSVQNYLKEHKNEKIARMNEENKGYLEQEKMERMIDVGDRLEEIDEKLQTIMNKTLDETDKNDIGQLMQVFKEIRKTMKFQKEYIEEVTTPNTEINNYEVTNNTAIQLSEKLMEYEQEGIIEIKKPAKLKK